MSGVDKYNKYLSDILPGFRPFDFADKSKVRSQYIRYMLNRTQSMFKWEGLPDTIPARILELYLQCNGNACFYEHEGNLYVFIGGRGGNPDVYYMPTIYTIANPALNLSVQANIDINCIVMPNDSMYMGLMPMFEMYASQMTETALSIDIATVNSRIVDLISAPDDRTRESAIQYLEDMRDGKLGVIASNEFLSGITATPYGSTGHGTITDLIELMQYQKASWFNDLGLNANYNMKRESINSGESQLNNDALLPLVDDMLNCRQKFAEKVNKMFGTEISVTMNSSWEDNLIETEAEQNMLLSEATGEAEAETPDEAPKGEEAAPTEDDTKTYEIGANDETPMNENQDIEKTPETETEETTEEVNEVAPVEVIVETKVDVIPVEETKEESNESEVEEDNEQTEDE